MSTLSVKGLSKSFKDVRAVREVSLTLEPGRVFGLIGPDGAGKTTAMRMISGLMSPDEGVVSVCGKRIDDDLHAVRPLMGYMPQQYSLYGDLSVRENFRFFSGMYGVPRKEIPVREKRLLDLARLLPYLDRPAGALSGGMYKKLALACALVHQPRLLLLDEPTNGVDPISRRELWTFLSELVREDVSVLVSTPYMDEAERCDEVGLLVEGSLVTTGQPKILREEFSQTVFEIDARPQFEAASALREMAHVGGVYTVGKNLHVLAPKGKLDKAEILGHLDGSGVSVNRVEIVSPSFEDIFLHVSSEEIEEDPHERGRPRLRHQS